MFIGLLSMKTTGDLYINQSLEIVAHIWSDMRRQNIFESDGEPAGRKMRALDHFSVRHPCCSAAGCSKLSNLLFHFILLID